MHKALSTPHDPSIGVLSRIHNNHYRNVQHLVERAFILRNETLPSCLIRQK